jgi:hypothetical protein
MRTGRTAREGEIKMAATTSAAIIDATESTSILTSPSILDEVFAIAGQAVSSAVTNQAHRAAVCGCGGCKAQAIETAEWAAEMLDIV